MESGAILFLTALLFTFDTLCSLFLLFLIRNKHSRYWPFYVCLFIFRHTHTHARTHARTHPHTHTHTHTHTHQIKYMHYQWRVGRKDKKETTNHTATQKSVFFFFSFFLFFLSVLTEKKRVKKNAWQRQEESSSWRVRCAERLSH